MNPDFVIQNNPDHPQRRPSQRVRVLAARRLFIDGPEADQRVDFVGERHRNRHRIGGDEIVRPLRLVVILDSMRDGFVFALRFGVILAHQALQLGKFADTCR